MMHHSAKLFGAIVISSLTLPTFPSIGHSGELEVANDQYEDSSFNEQSNTVLDVRETLSKDDNQLDDGRLYDKFVIETEADKVLAITLESTEFDTVLIVADVNSNILMSNDDIDTDNGNYHSFIAIPSNENNSIQVFVTGLNQWSSGEYKLLAHETTSLQVSPELSQRAQSQVEANHLRQAGEEQYRQSRFQQALVFFEQALQQYQDISDPYGEANTLDDIGQVYASLGQYERAIELYQQSLDIKILIGNVRGEADSFSRLGNAYRALNQHGRAIDLHERSLSIYQEIGDYRQVVISLTYLGLVYKISDQLELAIDAYQKALTASREHNTQSCEICILFAIGGVHIELQQHEQAINRYQQALDIARNLGDRQRDEANALKKLGQLYVVTGRTEEAIALGQQAIAIMREIGDRRGEAYALFSLGEIFKELGEIEMAIAFMKASIDVHEAIRRDISDLDIETQESYAAKISGCYRCLAELLLEQDRIIEAQQVLDFIRVQEIDHYLEGIQRTGNTETRVDFLRPEEAILARYDDLQDSAIAAGQKLDDLKSIPQEQRSEEQVQQIAQLTALLDDLNGDFRDFARSPEIRSLIDQLSFEAQEASLSLNQLDRLRDELQQLNAAIFYPLILEDRLE